MTIPVYANENEMKLLLHNMFHDINLRRLLRDIVPMGSIVISLNNYSFVWTMCQSYTCKQTIEF